MMAMTRARFIATAFGGGLLAAAAAGSPPAFAQQRERVPVARMDADACAAFERRAGEIRATLLPMLAELKQQQRDAQRIREAMGEDVAVQSIELIASQATRLETLLRDLDATRCTPVDPDRPNQQPKPR